MKRSKSLILALAILAGGLPVTYALQASAQVPPEDTPIAAARETEPVVLTGASFPTWAKPADVTLERPGTGGKECTEENPAKDPEACTHNQYEDPDFSSQEHLQQEGPATDRLLGYRWTGTAFEQIPFQVDEMFQRYLSNNNSGFAFYSETDGHHSYEFDREGFRWTDQAENDPCLARPASDPAKDPVEGLDTDDELVFMARDTGPTAAPLDAPLPEGVEDSYEVAVTDPINGSVSFAYVMLAGEDGPDPAFDMSNGYVKYERDENADVFLFSESSYDNYGAAPHGAYFDPATGTCVTETPKQRRPGDQATVTTPRYQFRYEGRWLMTELRVSQSEEGDWTYGPDLIDQWKARAFQQRPSGQTPCCGFEEEVNNWGGSSILMGERSGPVRAIRETWGADSGTNVVRREIFYRDEIRFGAFLRVHVIPPLDGIYAQWDYNALQVDTYYNPQNPGGVRIDGKNDERVGNSRVHVGPDGVGYCGEDDVSEETGTDCDEGMTQTPGTNEPDCKTFGQEPPDEMCIYNDIDSPDPTFSGVNAGLQWEQVAGDNGSIVWRTAIKHYTPGGTAQALAAVPYYRDDSCFDDGTGSNPGPHIHGRGTDGDETRDSRWDSDGDGVIEPHPEDAARECWDINNEEHVAALKAAYQVGRDGHPRFYQGSIGTHGVHILVIADSDNAGTTLPITEIDTEQRAVILPGNHQGSVGEAYGRHTEKPLVAVAHPEKRDQAGAEPEPTETPTSTPIETPTSTPSETPTSTPSETPSETPTSTPSESPTSTPTADPEPSETTRPDPEPSSPSDPPSNDPQPGGEPPPSASPSQRPDEEVTENQAPGRASSSISAKENLVRFNRPITLEGRVESSGCDSPPTAVTIQRRAHGTETFNGLADGVEVRRDGSWSAIVHSDVSASYIATPEDVANCTSVSSAPVDVFVKAKIKITKVKRECGNGRVRGLVQPSHAGDKVVLQMKKRGRFQYLRRDRLNQRSAFSFPLTKCKKTYRIIFRKQDPRNEGGTARFRF